MSQCPNVPADPHHQRSIFYMRTNHSSPSDIALGRTCLNPLNVSRHRSAQNPEIRCPFSITQYFVLSDYLLGWNPGFSFHELTSTPCIFSTFPFPF